MDILKALLEYSEYTYHTYINNHILSVGLVLIGLCWTFILYLAIVHPVTLHEEDSNGQENQNNCCDSCDECNCNKEK
ncbi:MAG: hypothetical protein ACTSPB_23655 [Candidatus Thorarchaeota archaeon]